MSPVVKQRLRCGQRELYRFPNGYGASVVEYSPDEAEVELVTIRWHDQGWSLCFETSVAGEVMRVDRSEVGHLLDLLSVLPEVVDPNRTSEN